MSVHSQEPHPQAIIGSRRFRHFFRHAYGVEIEYEQLKINLFKALALLPNLEKDIRHLVKKNVGTIHELSLQGFQATHI